MKQNEGRLKSSIKKFEFDCKKFHLRFQQNLAQNFGHFEWSEVKKMMPRGILCSKRAFFLPAT
jgi:hypothetical protein